MVMFIVTKEWLTAGYGSKPNQVFDTRRWLEKHAVRFNFKKTDLYSQYKHLAEYQPNCEDIVDQAVAMIGKEYESELQAHKFLNILRYPKVAPSYEEATMIIKPHSILELGVGGDAGISTAIHLACLEKLGGFMVSVDKDRLFSVWDRFGNVPFWTSIQKDSVQALDEYLRSGDRFDMIFVDTKPTYDQSKAELDRAYLLTDNIVLDDANSTGDHANWGVNPGKVGAIEEFLANNQDWDFTEYGDIGQVGVIRKRTTKTWEREEIEE